MKNEIRTFPFKRSEIEIEIKDLNFVNTVPQLLSTPHKTSFYQMIWITEGNAVFDVDFHEIEVCKNNILVIAPRQVCRFDVVSKYEGKLILFTEDFFSVSELDATFLATSELLNPTNLNRTALLSANLINNIASLLQNELDVEKDDYKKAIAHSYLRIILLETERHLQKSDSCNYKDNIARKFYNAVEVDFKLNRNVTYYLALLSVSEKTLSNELKKQRGITPKAYIDSRITLEIKRYLVYSNLSAKEIAYELGFDEATNFNKYFKRQTGMTPIEFKNSVI